MDENPEPNKFLFSICEIYLVAAENGLTPRKCYAEKPGFEYLENTEGNRSSKGRKEGLR